jgi:hypothetical protein
MIRPVTLLCFVAFAGAGAWLYQVKHSVALKDRQLLEIRRETEQARQRIDILRAEWALLNEPERLRRTATQILTLEPMQPHHFARVTEFERRLPQAVAFAGAPDLLAPEPAVAEPAVALAEAQPARPTPEPRAVEAPAPRALVAAVAAQRAEQATRPAPVLRAAPPPAPVANVAVAAAPPPRPIRPASQPAPTPQPAIAVTRVAQTTAAPTAVASALGAASSLGRPLLAPPVPIASAAAATLHGRGAPVPVPAR